jgi:hypothetical protein
MNPFSRQHREDRAYRESAAHRRLESTDATRLSTACATACATASAAHAAAAAR